MTTLLGPRNKSGNSMISSTQPIHMAQLTFSWLRDSVPIGTVTVSLVVAVIEPTKLNVFWSTLTKLLNLDGVISMFHGLYTQFTL